jgi:hypothetical protein
MLVATIGRYQIERELGRGAMGVVHLATDPQLHRQVAIKTCSLPDGLSEEQMALFHERFLREARAAASLSHPGIVTVYDAGEDATLGLPYIAMEYVPGGTLRQRLETGEKIDPAWVLSFGAVLADALHQAHRAGIVHRDIKPANILIRSGDGAVKLADFGVARLKASDLTQSGVPLGSPGYMSPEQVKGGDLDGRSDLFSLAVVLYEALCGKRPFRGDELVSLAYAIAHETHVPLARQLEGCPARLDRFFDRALSKDPDKRFPDGAAFRKGLLEVEADLTPDRAGQTVTDASTVGVATDATTNAIAPPIVASVAAAALSPSARAPVTAARSTAAAGAAPSQRRGWTFAALGLVAVGLGAAAWIGLGRPMLLKAGDRGPVVPQSAPQSVAAIQTRSAPAPLEPTRIEPAAAGTTASPTEAPPKREARMPAVAAPAEVETIAPAPKAPKYLRVTLPAGTEIPLAIDAAVGSATSQAGDEVTASISEPVLMGDRVVLPAGSRVHGRVVAANPATRGLADKAGSLSLAFDKVVTPAGFDSPMSAAVSSTGAGSGKKTAEAIGGGATGGALLGKFLGHSSKRTALGAAIGGAVGTAFAAGSHGQDVTFAAGTPLTVRLDQPLTISVNP